LKLSGADTKLWATKWLEGSTDRQYPPAALLKLFTKQEDAKKEVKKEARRVRREGRIKDSSTSLKDRSRERSNKERSA
jgi:hypothetical protein